MGAFVTCKSRQNLREDEAVTVQPVGVLGVEVEELVEQDVGNWGHSPVTTMSACCSHRSAHRRVVKLTWEHQGVQSCCERSHRPVDSSLVLMLFWRFIVRVLRGWRAQWNTANTSATAMRPSNRVLWRILSSSHCCASRVSSLMVKWRGSRGGVKANSAAQSSRETRAK